jgi:hypothetical protein
MPRRRAPLKARTPMSRGKGLEAGGPLKRTAGLPQGGPLERRARLAPVSDKRRRENRERRAMAAALWPERPLCVVYVLSQGNPGVIPDEVIARCGRWADDVHEPFTRARGGGIADPENAVAPCRPCHEEVTFRPESELDWAYDLGLLKHSWDAAGGGAA